jgi:hypothetical protein
MSFGPEREAHRRQAALSGLDARTADLSPSWKDADALVLTA